MHSPVQKPHNSNGQYEILDVEKALENIGDEDTVKELVAMMHEMLQGELPLAQAALDSGDYQGLRATLHRWNGSLGHFVNDAFARRVQQLERLANEGLATEVQSDWPACYSDFQKFSFEMLAFTKSS